MDEVSFAFPGKLTKVTLTIDRPKHTLVDEKRLRKAAERAADWRWRRVEVQRNNRVNDWPDGDLTGGSGWGRPLDNHSGIQT